MAKKLKNRISEVPRAEESIFMDIPLKQLPKKLQADHKARRGKIDKLHDKMNVLREQSANQIKELIKKAMKGGS